MSLRLRRTLKTYDIEASVQSRLLSGILDVSISTYQLTLPPRDREEYWSHKTTDGSRHGASWQNINWLRRPIDERMLQVHFSDRIKLPEASINFADLIYYLGDLGLQTNPEGFLDLAQKGLNALPGTCLVKEIRENSLEKPILVIAKPTIEHPGTLLLRFQNKPSKTLRTGRDLGPEWIRVPAFPATTEPAESKEVNRLEPSKLPEGSQASEVTELTQEKMEQSEQEIVEFVQINRKGIVEKKLLSGINLPIMGNPFWYTYSMLASTARNGHREYNGRPFGFQVRLEILYFSREFVVFIPEYYKAFGDPNGWIELLMQLVSPTKMDAIPSEWTEDWPARKDLHLTRRFEFTADVKMRNRAAQFRRDRQQAFELFRSDPDLFDTILPLEVFTIPVNVWSEVAGECSSYISPLTSHRVPTSQEICVAAISNTSLAMRIADTLMEFRKWFEEDVEPLWLRDDSLNYVHHKVEFICAIIILQFIAEGAGYLATLIDVEECLTKYDPIYLC